MKSEKDAVLWLCSLQGLGKAGWFRLWNAMGQEADFADELQKAPPEKLEAWLEDVFPGKEAGRKAFRILERGRKNLSPERCRERLERSGISFVWTGEEGFPARLRNIPDPPFLLYFRGRLPGEGRPSVGIVGARMASAYGREQARRFAGELAGKGAQIISGMAHGVDGIAGRRALEVSENSYAVLGCGVDFCYPEENRDLYENLCQKGGVISEYRPGTRPESRLFPARNRLISGLSDALLVVEAREKSGTLITVDCALEQGRDVYAIPGRLCDRGSSGCNELIRQGAGIAISPDLLWEELTGEECGKEVGRMQKTEPGIRTAKTKALRMRELPFEEDREERRNETGKETEKKETTVRLTDLERSILSALDGATPHGIEELLPALEESLGREPGFPEALRAMMRLAAAGFVHEIRVGKYIRRDPEEGKGDGRG